MDDGKSAALELRAPDEETRLAELKEAVQADWEQREFLNAAKAGVLRMYEFLQTFGEASSTQVSSTCWCEDSSDATCCYQHCTQKGIQSSWVPGH